MNGSHSAGYASLHVGRDWSVRCNTYPDTSPILSVYTDGMQVSVSIADREFMPDKAVEFARELARQAHVFAAECERLNAAQKCQPAGTGDGKDLAAGKAA